MSASTWQLLADSVLVLHATLVLFVVGMLGLVVVGNHLGWGFVNRWWLRVLHLAAIATVVAEAWLGLACPLTTLEHELRQQAGGAASGQGFIEQWVQRLLYYEAPAWVFGLAYTAFGLVVLWAWWRYPPRRRGHGRA